MTDPARRVRVAMVTPQFPPYRGGVETHVFEVGRRLVRDHGIEVVVLTSDRHLGLPRRAEMSGMLVHRVPAWPRNADVYWSPGIARAVAGIEADVVHVQGYHTLIPVLAMLAARRRRLPYVLTFHSGGHSSAVRQRIRPVQIRLLRPLLRSAAALVAVSPFEADLFGRGFSIGADRIRTIPNGADLPEGSDPGPRPRDAGLVLSVGRLERYKGHGRVLAAMPAVRERVPGARLEILGDGPQEAELRDAVGRLGLEGAVTIRSLPREQLPPLLRTASLVTLLSEYESHGLAVQEALSLGARVIVNDSTALAEVRHLPQVRAIAPDASTSDVAAAIVRHLGADSLGSMTVPALPTWDACAAALAALYRGIASDRLSSPVAG